MAAAWHDHPLLFDRRMALSVVSAKQLAWAATGDTVRGAGIHVDLCRSDHDRGAVYRRPRAFRGVVGCARVAAGFLRGNSGNDRHRAGYVAKSVAVALVVPALLLVR